MVAIAKITTKGQTTIPQEVRAALHVAPGDLIAWEGTADGTATVRRVQPVDLAQAAIGPGMAVYTRYSQVLDAAGKPLSVREALAFINQTLD